MGDIEVEIRMGSYVFRVKTQQHLMKPKPRDILKFDLAVTIRYWGGYVSRRRLIRTTTLIDTTKSVICESFFGSNNDFFQSFSSNLLSYPYFDQESLDQMSQRIVYWLKQLLEDFPSDPDQSPSSECQQEFPLTLAIFVDIVEGGEGAVIEESMQQSGKMIPSSDEAIQCLKTVTDSLLLKNEKCNICMDKFCVEEGSNDDVKVSSMPCDHVFHHQCIVKWLQTSHTCPLCRYAVPTAKN